MQWACNLTCSPINYLVHQMSLGALQTGYVVKVVTYFIVNVNNNNIPAVGGWSKTVIRLLFFF